MIIPAFQDAVAATVVAFGCLADPRAHGSIVACNEQAAPVLDVAIEPGGNGDDISGCSIESMFDLV